jgi:hypothetical protein
VRNKRFWNFSSSETVEQQRLRLIHQFLDVDEILEEWDPADRTEVGDWEKKARIPTTEEIDTILRPWRPDHIREMAWRMWGQTDSMPLMLRTHYNSKDDEVVLELIAASEMFEDVAWWASLNDPEFFNFGAQWWLVYDILPEAAGPLQEYSRISNVDHVAFRKSYMESLRIARRIHSEEWKEDQDQCIMWAGTRTLYEFRETYIMLVDEETFKTHELNLIFLDGKRNILAERRMSFDDCDIITEIIMNWDQTYEDDPVWEGIRGEKYQLDGEFGKELFQLDEKELALLEED